ncbi:hypothetical protein [Streptomyces sp. PA5.6]|uniref:hypothetical protein n=1 Tax=Streptomyces sp. PA5.6 TaxID=3035651 RepID=UPI00390497B8
MSARTGLAGISLAFAAVLGPLATTGTAAEPTPAPAPAPDDKLTASICAYVQNILKDIKVLQELKIDGMNPQTVGPCGKDAAPTSTTPQGQHTELVEINFPELFADTM